MKKIYFLFLLLLFSWQITNAQWAGGLIVKSYINNKNVNVSVKFNNIEKGTTPFRLILKPGTYTVLVEKKIDEFSKYYYKGKVVVVNGKIDDLNINLEIVYSPGYEKKLLPEMVSIPGGTFQMGNYDGGSNEKPVHSVTVSSFKMSKYEITHEQFIYFLNDIGCNSNGSYNGKELIDMESSDCAVGYDNQFYFRGRPCARFNSCPVIEVTWYGADAYCKWLSRKTGKTYRLPTEAEWEYAAGGGSSHTKYAGTNSESAFGSYAWYEENCNYIFMNKTYKGTHIVGRKTHNKYGLYDMSGNVCEWCSDWYDANYYSSSPSSNPKGPSSGSCRVLRGGSWDFSAYSCSVVHRECNGPSRSSNFLGFRIVSF